MKIVSPALDSLERRGDMKILHDTKLLFDKLTGRVARQSRATVALAETWPLEKKHKQKAENKSKR